MKLLLWPKIASQWWKRSVVCGKLGKYGAKPAGGKQGRGDEGAEIREQGYHKKIIMFCDINSIK